MSDDVKQRIRDLIRAAPHDTTGAPIRWVKLAEQGALTEMIASGEVECVAGEDPYRTYIRCRGATRR